MLFRQPGAERGHPGAPAVTVRKALDALKDEGLIETTPGYGTFVASR